MTTLKLLISQQTPKFLEGLQLFGTASIHFNEQLSMILKSDIALANRLSFGVLKREYKSLKPIEKRFYEYHSYKIRLMDIAESSGWPVLDHVFLIPMLPITQLKPIIEEVRTRFPLETFDQPVNNGILMRTNQQNLGAVKLCVSEMAGFELTKLRDISIERAGSIIIGFRTEKETQDLIELCQKHLKQNKRKTGLKSLKNLFQRA